MIVASRALLAAVALALSAPAPAMQAGAGLAAEVAEAARQLSARLPMRADEITTAFAIRAEGTEFVYDMRVDRPLPDERIDEIRQAIQNLNQTRMCENADIAPFIRRGGSMRHVYTDTAGHRFETRIVRCP